MLGEPVQGSPICPGAALKTRTSEHLLLLVAGGGLRGTQQCATSHPSGNRRRLRRTGVSPWGLARTLLWAKILSRGWRKLSERDQLGFWTSVSGRVWEEQSGAF